MDNRQGHLSASPRRLRPTPLRGSRGPAGRDRARRRRDARRGDHRRGALRGRLRRGPRCLRAAGHPRRRDREGERRPRLRPPRAPVRARRRRHRRDRSSRATRPTTRRPTCEARRGPPRATCVTSSAPTSTRTKPPPAADLLDSHRRQAMPAPSGSTAGIGNTMAPPRARSRWSPRALTRAPSDRIRCTSSVWRERSAERIVTGDDGHDQHVAPARRAVAGQRRDGRGVQRA